MRTSGDETQGSYGKFKFSSFSSRREIASRGSAIPRQTQFFETAKGWRDLFRNAEIYHFPPCSAQLLDEWHCESWFIDSCRVPSMVSEWHREKLLIDSLRVPSTVLDDTSNFVCARPCFDGCLMGATEKNFESCVKGPQPHIFLTCFCMFV